MWQSSRTAAEVLAGEWPTAGADGSAKGVEGDPSTVIGATAGGAGPKHGSAMAMREDRRVLSACDLKETAAETDRYQ